MEYFYLCEISLKYCLFMKTLTFILLFSIAFPAFGLSTLPDNVTDKISLAEKYKKEMNYDKALQIYQELLVGNPDNTAYMVSSAEIQILMGDESEALSTYQSILALEPDNLSANIYLGNYYFLTAELKREALQNDFKKLSSPTRTQHADFRKEMNVLYITSYSRSKEYLQKVMTLFPSAEAKRTLEKIEKLEKYLKIK